MSDNAIKDWYRFWLWVIVIITAIAIVLVLTFGSGIEDYKDRVSFLAVNIVSIFAFDMVLISALTAREMKEIMDRQEIEMTKQRIAAEAENDLTEQSLELARLSAKITKDQLELAKLTQRPEFHIGLQFEVDIEDRRIQMVLNAPNVGHSTAYDFGIHICPAWQPQNFDGWLVYEKPPDNTSEPIRAGTPHFVHTQGIVFNDLTLFRRFLTGDAWFIVYGIYWFYDGAGNRYEEKFCRRLNHLDLEHAVQCSGEMLAKVVPFDPDKHCVTDDNTDGAD